MQCHPGCLNILIACLEMYGYLVLSRGRVFEEKKCLPSMFIPLDFQILLYHSSATGCQVFGLRLDYTIGVFFMLSFSIPESPKMSPRQDRVQQLWFDHDILVFGDCTVACISRGLKHAHAGDSELLVFTHLCPMVLLCAFCRSLEHCHLSKV